MTALGAAAPDMSDEFDGRLYRAVARDRGEAMLRDGQPPVRSHWGVHAIASYYAETVADDGDEPVVVSAPIEAFDPSLLVEDEPGFCEPISTVVGSSEDAIHAAWSKSDRSWTSSLALIGSVAYDGPLPASSIRLENPSSK